jgi:hypothetical protein
MASRAREVADRYTKKTLAHIEWLRSLPPLQSIAARRRDILRHCLRLREIIRDGYRSPDLPADEFLQHAQESLVLLRKERSAAKKALH